MAHDAGYASNTLVTAATSETRLSRVVLTIVALGFVALFLLLPLATVFIEAFRKGAAEFFTALGVPRPFPQSG